MAAKSGDTVHVHYTGTLDDGTTFDSSQGREPLEFTIGAGQVIPGFDAAVDGLEIGESKTITIPAKEAYGEHNPEATQRVPKGAFEQEPMVGGIVELSSPEGQRFSAVIVEVGEDDAVLDFNHPLAGKDLTFEIELVEVVEG